MRSGRCACAATSGPTTDSCSSWPTWTTNCAERGNTHTDDDAPPARRTSHGRQLSDEWAGATVIVWRRSIYAMSNLHGSMGAHNQSHHPRTRRAAVVCVCVWVCIVWPDARVVVLRVFYCCLWCDVKIYSVCIVAVNVNVRVCLSSLVIAFGRIVGNNVADCFLRVTDHRLTWLDHRYFHAIARRSRNRSWRQLIASEKTVTPPYSGTQCLLNDIIKHTTNRKTKNTYRHTSIVIYVDKESNTHTILTHILYNI